MFLDILNLALRNTKKLKLIILPILLLFREKLITPFPRKLNLLGRRVEKFPLQVGAFSCVRLLSQVLQVVGNLVIQAGEGSHHISQNAV